MRVLVPLAEGLEEIEAVTIIDVLRRGGVEVVSASLGKGREVCGSHGVTLLADTLWPADGEFDAIDESVEKELDDAIEFSRNSPHPLPEDCLKHVFVGEDV